MGKIRTRHSKLYNMLNKEKNKSHEGEGVKSLHLKDKIKGLVEDKEQVVQLRGAE